MGVVAMEENKEQAAAGIAMAAYGIATVMFAILMSISGFRRFVEGLACNCPVAP